MNRIDKNVSDGEIKLWIERQVYVRKELSNLSKFKDELVCYDDNCMELMIYSPGDLRRIAKILSLSVTIETVEDRNYIGTVSFHYKGLNIYSFCYNYKELIGE